MIFHTRLDNIALRSLVVLFFIWYFLSGGQADQLQDGVPNCSPDGRFSLTLVSTGDLEPEKLVVRDLEQKGKATNLDFTSVLNIYWLKNSKAFCTVEPIVGGSTLEMHVYNIGVWSAFSVEPPGPVDGCAVVAVIPHEDWVSVTYKVYIKPDVFYIQKLSAGLNKNQIKVLSRKTIGSDAYDNM